MRDKSITDTDSFVLDPQRQTPCVMIATTSNDSLVLPWAYFICLEAHLDANKNEQKKEVVRVVFTSFEVVFQGERLRKLVNAFQTFTLSRVGVTKRADRFKPDDPIIDEIWAYQIQRPQALPYNVAINMQAPPMLPSQ